MNHTDTPARYDARTILLHWTTAGLVVALWALGQTIDWFPKGTLRIGARGTHILLGVVLAAVLVARIRWRLSGGARLPSAEPAWLGRAAKLGHGLLYLLLVAAVLLGVANVWVRGDNIFNLFTVPAFDPGNKALRHQVGDLHEWAANLLGGLALLHAAAALFHHQVLKDGVLLRMRRLRGAG